MNIENINSFNPIDQIQKDPSLTSKKIDRLRESQDDKELMDTLREFEGIFLHMMLKEMRKTVGDGGLIEKSQGSKIFEEMHIEELSKEMSKGEGMGIAKMMYDQFKNGRKSL